MNRPSPAIADAKAAATHMQQVHGLSSVEYEAAALDHPGASADEIAHSLGQSQQEDVTD